MRIIVLTMPGPIWRRNSVSAEYDVDPIVIPAHEGKVMAAPKASAIINCFIV